MPQLRLGTAKIKISVKKERKRHWERQLILWLTLGSWSFCGTLILRDPDMYPKYLRYIAKALKRVKQMSVASHPSWLSVFSPFLVLLFSLLFVFPISFPHLLSGFPGDSVVKNPPTNAGDAGSIPGLGRSPGGGNGNPLQYSCRGNPTGRRAWRATVPGVAKSRIQLSMHAHTYPPPLPPSPLFSFSLLSQTPCTSITSLPTALSSFYFNILTSPYVTCSFSSLLPSLFLSASSQFIFYFPSFLQKKKMKMEKENNLIVFGLPKTDRGQGHCVTQRAAPTFLIKAGGKITKLLPTHISGSRPNSQVQKDQREVPTVSWPLTSPSPPSTHACPLAHIFPSPHIPGPATSPEPPQTCANPHSYDPWPMLPSSSPSQSLPNLPSWVQIPPLPRSHPWPPQLSETSFL